MLFAVASESTNHRGQVAARALHYPVQRSVIIQAVVHGLVVHSVAVTACDLSTEAAVTVVMLSVVASEKEHIT